VVVDDHVREGFAGSRKSRRDRRREPLNPTSAQAERVRSLVAAFEQRAVRRKPGTVQRTLPRLIGVIPFDDAAEVWTYGRHDVLGAVDLAPRLQLPGRTAELGGGIQPCTGPSAPLAVSGI
jgi:hypothetical protein